MASPMLEVVGGRQDPLPAPPYPATIRADGWKFDLDIARVKQSDTWTLARPEIRPWLLMLWMTAWEQCPCGSLPSDDALIRALLGIEAALFDAHRQTLLRGWIKHADNRLYHQVITEHVETMIHRRLFGKARQAKFRNALVTRQSRVSNAATGSTGSRGQVSTGSTKNQERVARATRLPPDWKLPEDWKQEAIDAHHLEAAEVVRISVDFRDYWHAKARDNTKLDWRATFRRWVRKEVSE